MLEMDSKLSLLFFLNERLAENMILTFQIRN
jgi:hypothetical protein